DGPSVRQHTPRQELAARHVYDLAGQTELSELAFALGVDTPDAARIHAVAGRGHQQDVTERPADVVANGIDTAAQGVFDRRGLVGRRRDPVEQGDQRHVTLARLLHLLLLRDV